VGLRCLAGAGGVPDPWRMTGGRYSSSWFVGCISDLHLNSRGPLDYTRHAVRVVAVAPCRRP